MQYHVQDPQGNDRIIEGPAGASDEEIINQAKNLFGHSGAMPTQDPMVAFKQALANHPARPNPQAASFDQDIATGNAVPPPEQRILNVMQPVAGGAALGSMAAGAGLWAGAKASQGLGSLMDFLNTPKAAEALAAPESALEAGTNINAAKASGEASRAATATDMYNSIPKDIKPPLPVAKNTLDTILNETKGLSPDSQKEIGGLVKNYQDFVNDGKASIGDIMTEMSRLKKIAVNGDGVETVYAAKLSKALAQDLENFGNSPVLPPSMQNTEFAPALKKMWANRAIEEAGGPANISLDNVDQVLKYQRPDNFNPANATPLTNADIPNGVKDANRYYQYKAYLENHPLSQALNKAHLETNANVIFKGKSLEDLNTAKLILGEGGYQQAAGQLYNKLRDSLNAGKDASQVLGKYTPEYLNEALGANRAQQLFKLAHFNNLVSMAKKAVFVGLPAAGTAFGIYEGLKH